MKCRKGHVGSSMIQDNNLGRSASIANILHVFGTVVCVILTTISILLSSLHLSSSTSLPPSLSTTSTLLLKYSNSGPLITLGL